MTNVSILEAVQTYLEQYTELDNDEPIWVNWLGPNLAEFGIMEIPITTNIDESIDSSEQNNQFAFALQATMSNADDQTRIANGKFFELFRDWLVSQRKAKLFPVISSSKLVYHIEAVNGAAIIQEGESSSSIYEISCIMLYLQAI